MDINPNYSRKPKLGEKGNTATIVIGLVVSAIAAVALGLAFSEIISALLEIANEEAKSIIRLAGVAGALAISSLITFSVLKDC